MIVRNEERTLPVCLESVRGLFDETIVVDTGSTDRTKEITSQFGARVIDFPWVDDFSAARNVSLAHATGDFVVWLDADDVIDALERRKLESLFQTLRPGQKEAYTLICASDRDSGGSHCHISQITVDQHRLLPRFDGLRWVYRVHEQILPSLLQAHIAIRQTDIVVRHTGYVDAKLRERKRERDWDLLLKDLSLNPQDPFIFYNLGMIAFEREQWKLALTYFELSFQHTPVIATSMPLRRRLFSMRAWVNSILDNHQQCLIICNQGLLVDPQDAELLFRKAVAYKYMGSVSEAEACWRSILTLKRTDKQCSIDLGIYGHMTRRNLALIAGERGDLAEAEAQWRAVLEECPGDPQALNFLRTVILAQEQLASAKVSLNHTSATDANDDLAVAGAL
jgi:hypothetical protein